MPISVAPKLHSGVMEVTNYCKLIRLVVTVPGCGHEQSAALLPSVVMAGLTHDSSNHFSYSIIRCIVPLNQFSCVCSRKIFTRIQLVSAHAQVYIYSHQRFTLKKLDSSFNHAVYKYDKKKRLYLCGAIFFCSRMIIDNILYIKRSVTIHQRPYRVSTVHRLHSVIVV